MADDHTVSVAQDRIPVLTKGGRDGDPSFSSSKDAAPSAQLVEERDCTIQPGLPRTQAQICPRSDRQTATDPRGLKPRLIFHVKVHLLRLRRLQCVHTTVKTFQAASMSSIAAAQVLLTLERRLAPNTVHSGTTLSQHHLAVGRGVLLERQSRVGAQEHREGPHVASSAREYPGKGAEPHWSRAGSRTSKAARSSGVLPRSMPRRVVAQLHLSPA